MGAMLRFAHLQLSGDRNDANGLCAHLPVIY